jgi:hypothetical protein
MAGFATSDYRDRHADLEWPSGDRDSRWSLFAQDSPGDRATPNAWQVMVLSDLSGPDGRCVGATDDEVLGVLGQWSAAGAWLEGRKLAVLRELIRRRPDERNVGAATDSGLPWDWDDRLSREIALGLRISVPAARKLLWTAWALEARLPGVGEALGDGRIDAGRAKMIVEETNVLLEPAKLAEAEQLILTGLATCKTWMDLLRLVQRAVVTVDPDGARKRREQEEKENARIRFWRESAGTCALMGAGLPTDEALRAHAHVEQRAQQYREAGAKRGIDILRVAAYLDLLNGTAMTDRLARLKAEDEARAADEAKPTGREATKQPARKNSAAANDDRAQPGGSPEQHSGARAITVLSPETGPAPAGTTSRRTTATATNGCCCGYDNGCGCGAMSDCRPNGGPSAPPPGPATAAEVNLTLRHVDIPFLTAAGYAQRPGEARSLGVLDPDLARGLAEAAARHPGSKFCVTIVDDEGHAVGHGCCKPRKQRKSGEGQRDGPAPTRSA